MPSLSSTIKFILKIFNIVGGGPPPSSEDPLPKIKKFIDPQIDGLYTIYDGDAELVDQFQKSKPVEEQIQPIEINFIEFDNKACVTPAPSTSNYSGEKR